MIHLTDTLDYQENEQFIPLDVQYKTKYAYSKDTSLLKYNEITSFISEDGSKEADLQVPVCDKD